MRRRPRPEGRSGQLVRSVPSYEAWWERWAQPWEFQALLKARPVAGDAELGEAFATAASEALWRNALSDDDLRSIREMKERSEREVSSRGLDGREIKRGRVGIRDV